MKSSKLLSLLTALATAVLVLSGSIAVPILCRPFYYAHIEAMSLPEYTGLTVDQIKQAFDEMLDFCLGLRQDFSVGVLSWSESGRDHFSDVRVLFQLDLVLLVLSAAALVLLFLFARKRRLTPARLLGRGPGFWAAAGLAAVFLAVGALAVRDLPLHFLPGQDQLDLRLAHRPHYPPASGGLFPQLRHSDSGPAGILVRGSDRGGPAGGPPEKEGTGGPHLLPGLFRRSGTVRRLQVIFKNPAKRFVISSKTG